MKQSIVNILFIVIIISIHSCNMWNETEAEKTWKLGWRMVENSWDKNYSLAELQFDSLLAINESIEDIFLINGLKAKIELLKEEEALAIIADQPNEIQSKICEKQFARDLKPCFDSPKEKVENEALQLEIIKLYVDDQARRRNVMKDIIVKYQIDSTTIKTPEDKDTDEINRERLKEIFKKHGFPTRKLIGREAMHGVFLIIQHADGDLDWQKSQLPNIEAAVKNGDLSKKEYAYLYDRIKVNSGQQQKFGTQFLKVDRTNQIAELKDTEDLANLNQRRRKMGMMPIEVYKRSMLRNHSNK